MIYEKAFNFAIRTVELYKYLCNEKNEYVLPNQILRSGTSIGANIYEAVYASSKKDFLMKMNIALKEASETNYWLELLKTAEFLDENVSEVLIQNCKEIIKLLSSIVKTTKDNLQSDAI